MRARQPPEPLSDSSSRAAALSRPRCLPMSRGTGRPVQAPRNLAMPAPSRPLQPGIPQSGHKSRFPPLCAGLGATRTRRVASNVRNAGGDDPKLPPLGVGEDVAPACEKERTHSYLLRTRAHTHTPAERHEWEARDPRISRTGKELPSEPLSAFPAAPDPQKKKKKSCPPAPERGMQAPCEERAGNPSSLPGTAECTGRADFSAAFCPTRSTRRRFHSCTRRH